MSSELSKELEKHRKAMCRGVYTPADYRGAVLNACIHHGKNFAESQVVYEKEIAKVCRELLGQKDYEVEMNSIIKKCVGI